MKKYLKLFAILFLIVEMVSCNGKVTEPKKSEINERSFNKKIIIPALFDRKYFHGYQLSPTSDFPIYTDITKSRGELTVSFIHKNIDEQTEWYHYGNKNGLYAEDNPDDKYFEELNSIIKKKLNPNLNIYSIITEYVSGNYLEEKTLEHKYPYKKRYYLYNPDKKSWNLIKEKTINDGSNEKNITKLEELNEMLNIGKSNFTKNNSKLKTILPISSIFDKDRSTKLWSNHCEKGVEKDNIIFYDPDEIAFGISSINFICGATSKQITTNTVELYLKDSGKDYAPNGEIYSNNNVPKGINFDDLSQTEPIAQVKILDKDKVEFKWLGFYNKKTKKREYLQNPFDKSKNPAIIYKCSES